MVRQFHDCMQARVQNDGELTNGVTQGCVMAPTHAHGCFAGQ